MVQPTLWSKSATRVTTSNGWPTGPFGAGVAARLAAALIYIREQLRQRPLEWGEPSRSVASLGLILCEGIHDRLHVSYGVHVAEALVFVRRYQALPGHPLVET